MRGLQHPLHRERGLPPQLQRQLQRRLLQLLNRRACLMDQPDPLGLVSVEKLAAQGHVQGCGLADRLGPGHTGARQQPLDD